MHSLAAVIGRHNERTCVAQGIVRDDSGHDAVFFEPRFLASHITAALFSRLPRETEQTSDAASESRRPKSFDSITGPDVH